MKRLLIAIVLPVTMGFAQTPAPDQLRTIRVHGVGVIATAPDQVRLTVQVHAREASASSAMKAASGRSREILSLLSGYGVKTEEIQTSRVTVSPVLDYEKRIQPPPVVGYTGSNEFTVIFKGKLMEKIGEFMDRAVAAGASGFGSLQFESSKARELERDALVNAASDARARATVIAKELGATLGRIHEVSESSSAPMPMLRSGALSVAAESSSPVSSGEVTIRAEVTVVFELE